MQKTAIIQIEKDKTILDLLNQISKQAMLEFSENFYCFKYFDEDEENADVITNLLSYTNEKQNSLDSADKEDRNKKLAREFKEFEKLVYNTETLDFNKLISSLVIKELTLIPKPHLIMRGITG